MGELLDWLVAHDESFRTARLPSLYSDFTRQKATNPDGYVANIATWRTGLAKAVSSGVIPGENNTMSLQVGEHLLQALRSSEYGVPSALGSVIEECLADSQIMPVDSFRTTSTSIYDKSWTLPSASAVIGWALRRLGLGALGGGQPANARYVIVGNVEAAAAKLERYLNEPRGRLERLMPREVFRREISEAMGFKETVSELDLEVLLVHLARDKNAIVYNDSLVKICGTAEKDRQITSQDAEVASIKALQLRLSEQEATLAQRVQQRSEEAKKQVAQGNKSAALRALRAKKNHEAILEKRSASLAQIEGVLAKIQEAADQVEMVKAMEGSASVLKTLNAETGGRENVDRIMDSLQDELDQAEDIGVSMQGAGPVVDEGEVDDELAALEEETENAEKQREENRTREQLAGIPSVPEGVGEAEKARTEAADKTLEQDIAALGRLSMEDPATTTEGDKSQKEPEAAPAT